MNLEIGGVYRRADGHTTPIGGLVKDHPEWVWGVDGNWYEKATGKYVFYGPETLQHFVLDHANWRDLTEDHNARC